MDGAPEDIALAVEIIRQLEKLDYPEESILRAMIHVCQDTLNKLPNDETRKLWQQKLIMELSSHPKPESTQAH